MVALTGMKIQCERTKDHFDNSTETDKDGKFDSNVRPGQRSSCEGGGVPVGRRSNNWTPTIVTEVTSLPGETAHVELGRDGRQVVGKLLLPPDAEAGNDWRRAMISMQSRPRTCRS